MKTFVTGIILSALVAPAMAADLPARMPVKAPAAVTVLYDWSGFYIGGHAGRLSGDSDWALGGGTTTHDIDGFVGGFQTGIQRQWDRMVLGIEGALSGRRIDGSSTCLVALACTSDIDHFWRVGVRAGYAAGATGNWLLYAMGGFARANLRTNVSGIDGDRTHHHGWFGGGGVEYGVTPNFIIGVEAYHVSLGDERHGVGLVTGRNVDLDFSVIQARASWKFGWAGPFFGR
jgi:outer membrane immunogenic protein